MTTASPTRHSAPTGSRLAAPREEVHNALLEAVGRLILRYGYRKTSVEDIAQEAGVSRATAYLYFENKEALVLGWIAQRDEQRLDGLRSLADREGGAPEKVAALLLARILVRFDDAQPYTERIDDLLAALRVPVMEMRDRNHEAEAVLVAERLREGIASGDFAPMDDPLETARLLLVATNGLLPYNLSARQLGERSAVESRARGLITLLIGGLRRSANEL